MKYEELVLYGYDEWQEVVYILSEKFPKANISENEVTLNGERLARVREGEFDIILTIKKGILF